MKTFYFLWIFLLTVSAQDAPIKHSPFKPPGVVEYRSADDKLPSRPIVSTDHVSIRAEPENPALDTFPPQPKPEGTGPVIVPVVQKQKTPVVQEVPAVKIPSRLPPSYDVDPMSSPFGPPPADEWMGQAAHVQRTHRVQEVQQPQRKASPIGIKSRTRTGPKKRPTAYQDGKFRDMHDSDPGVTPWTRYTARPRQAQEQRQSNRDKEPCGNRRYSPRTEICCQGEVIRRSGVKPDCCGKEQYDSVFQRCCGGQVRFGAHC